MKQIMLGFQFKFQQMITVCRVFTVFLHVHNVAGNMFMVKHATTESFLPGLTVLLPSDTHTGDHCEIEIGCPFDDCAKTFSGGKCKVRFVETSLYMLKARFK